MHLPNDLYTVNVDGKRDNIFDTVSLSEDKSGLLSDQDAITNLYCLVCRLSSTQSDGIRLLVFVVKLGRITGNMIKNYTIFHQSICKQTVPIVLVITHAETADEDWWRKNGPEYRWEGMTFNGHGCITDPKSELKSSRYSFQEEYDEMREALMNLIFGNCLGSDGCKSSVRCCCFALASRNPQIRGVGEVNFAA
ncbi:hypothetical protein K438DRAFT_979986 [Mycena galopus ATCC 62051]|nr:hypothetical protein K438DRAFT_979986 [Mycena galopus ATCC 62051]